MRSGLAVAPCHGPQLLGSWLSPLGAPLPAELAATPACPDRTRCLFASVARRYVDQLVAEGKAYPCFCTDEELEAMKKEAEVRCWGKRCG